MRNQSGELVRDARLRAGLTQSRLGARARVAQSVVSAYESGSRKPSLETLGKLVEAAGFTLNISLMPTTAASPLLDRVTLHREELKRELGKLGASNIRLFGSVARGDESEGSDVDLLVDVDDTVGLFALGRMRSVAERILGVEVDVVPSNSLKQQVAQSAVVEAVPL